MTKKEYKGLHSSRIATHKKTQILSENGDFSAYIDMTKTLLSIDHKMIENWHLGSGNSLIESLNCLVSVCDDLSTTLCAIGDPIKATNLYIEEIKYLSDLVQSDTSKWGDGYTGHCLFVSIAELNLNYAILLDVLGKGNNEKVQKALAATEKWLLLTFKLPYYLPSFAANKHYKNVRQQYLNFLKNRENGDYE